ncbi:MAG: hypothetical protein R3D57_20720 [Hyphomicrobiaceae bacterium]|jgi:hypothetical protein
MLKISVSTLAVAALLAGAGMASAGSAHRGGGLTFLHTMVSEGGKTCFGDHYHHGKGRAQSEDEAKMKAGQAWSWLVAAEYGKDWAAWGLAADASMTCVKGERSYRCYAHARPCRY